MRARLQEAPPGAHPGRHSEQWLRPRGLLFRPYGYCCRELVPVLLLRWRHRLRLMPAVMPVWLPLLLLIRMAATCYLGWLAGIGPGVPCIESRTLCGGGGAGVSLVTPLGMLLLLLHPACGGPVPGPMLPSIEAVRRIPPPLRRCRPVHVLKAVRKGGCVASWRVPSLVRLVGSWVGAVLLLSAGDEGAAAAVMHHVLRSRARLLLLLVVGRSVRGGGGLRGPLPHGRCGRPGVLHGRRRRRSCMVVVAVLEGPLDAAADEEEALEQGRAQCGAGHGQDQEGNGYKQGLRVRLYPGQGEQCDAEREKEGDLREGKRARLVGLGCRCTEAREWSCVTPGFRSGLPPLAASPPSPPSSGATRLSAGHDAYSGADASLRCAQWPATVMPDKSSQRSCGA